MSHDQRRGAHLASDKTEPTGAPGPRPFQVIESVVEGGCREIGIEGEIDLSVADRLQEAIAGCQGDPILINLRSCQFIDSTGIAVFLTANRENGSRVVLHSPTDQVLRVLEVTGLTAEGLVFANREEALAATAQALTADR